MADTTYVKPYIAGSGCVDCTDCCGAACGDPYRHCRGGCWPCCYDCGLGFQPNLRIPALFPVGYDANGLIAPYKPSLNNGVTKPIGLSMHVVETDANGNMTNFDILNVYAKGCGQKTGCVYTTGEFPKDWIANGDVEALNEALSYPGFMAELPFNYVRLMF